MRFSQRNGMRPKQKLAQIESIDKDLRTRIWNVLQIRLWDLWEPEPASYSMSTRSSEAELIDKIVSTLWCRYFNRTLDSLPIFRSRHGHPSAHEFIRKYLFESRWYDVFDLVEEIIDLTPNLRKADLSSALNHVLEIENSGYRLLNGLVVKITDESEAGEVAQATNSPSPDSLHIQRALELLSDRKTPDYRNSIKESISAVESVCKEITKTSKGDIGECLRIIKSRHHLHPPFEQALTKLYAYTSDDGGIRHALTEEHEEPTFADAKFMLVACSAFVNYLRTVLTEY